MDSAKNHAVFNSKKIILGVLILLAVALLVFILFPDRAEQPPIGPVKEKPQELGKIRVEDGYFRGENGGYFYVFGTNLKNVDGLESKEISGLLEAAKASGFNTVATYLDTWKLNSADQKSGYCEKVDFFLNEVKRLGLKAIIYIDAGDALNDGLEAANFVKECRIAGREEVLAYGIINYELSLGHYELNLGGFDNLYREGLDADFAGWIEQNYGSIENAEKLLGKLEVYRPSNDAECISHDIPAEMSAGKTYGINFEMKNTGPETWVKEVFSQPYYFARAIGDAAEFVAANPKTLLFAEALEKDIGAGETAAFSVKAVAPEKAGVYTVGWRMKEINNNYFGAECSASVVVKSAAEKASDSQEKIFPEKAGDVAVRGLSDSEYCNSSSSLAANYRRFLGDFVSHKWREKKLNIRGVDSETLLTAKQGIVIGKDFACEKAYIDASAGRKHLDFLGLEGWNMDAEMRGAEMGAEEMKAYAGMAADYFYFPGKPLVFLEYGYNTKANSNGIRHSIDGQREYYGKFLDALKGARIMGAVNWWLAGKQGESDLGILEPETLGERPVVGALKSFFPPQLPFRRDERQVGAFFTRENQYAGKLLDDELFPQYVSGKNGFKAQSACAGKTSAERDYCVGGFEAESCARECLNSEFYRIEILGRNGWEKVRNNGTALVEAGKPVKIRVLLSNTGEAEWIESGVPAVKGGVELRVTNEGSLVASVPLSENVEALQDYGLGEFEVPALGEGGVKNLKFRLYAEGNGFFGEQAEATIKAG